MDTGRIASRLLSLTGRRYWQKWDKGKIAHQVDRYWFTDEGEQQFRQMLGAYLKAEFGEKVPILEVGCGTGLIYESLLAHDVVTSKSYIGGDVSENMLNIARERSPGVVFLPLDILALPYESNSQPNVICVHVIQHLPNYKAAIKELIRVTGHKLCVVSWFNTILNDKPHFGKTEYENTMFYNNTYSLPNFLRFISQTMGGELTELHATKLGGNTVAVSVTKDRNG